ncbi:uncharacterized protein LOC133912678 isoform X2 [Phragmites australis]|uniref:uncharacterized protein LOC133912678 isoform X2 n=1 Tax=Phragmites australis TaxID=29695 RepID=UPI002D78FEE4|nr:uncharacterized protein LOC133912678 isoform X2 [Phragmites australis]
MQQGPTQEFRIVKDNRTKQKDDGEAVPEAMNGNKQAVSSVKSSTEKLAAQHCLVDRNDTGCGETQADNGIKIAVRAHDKEVKSSGVRKLEQFEGMQTTFVGSHAVLEKGELNRVVTVASGKNKFAGELCCSSSDPIHVPSPGSKSAGTLGAIKREVGAVGARQQPSDSAATGTSTSNSLVKGTSGLKDNTSNDQQSGFPIVSLKNARFNSPVSLSSRPFPSSQYHSKPQNHVNRTKVNPHLEWKPKSISPSAINHEVNVAPSGAPSPVDGNQVEVACLSKKLSRANLSKDEHVIIPEHIRVPDSKKTHLIFGSFESKVDPKSSVAASHTVVTKEDMTDHSPSSLTALNSIISTDIVSPNDQTDHVGSHDPLPQSYSVVSASEHHRLLTEDMEVPSPGVICEFGTNEMISNKVTHSSPQFQHQDSPAMQNFKEYEPDSRYGMQYITKVVDGETAQTVVYPSEVMGLHPANVNQYPVSAATQQPVPQIYPQQFQVPQYPNFLPFRHVFSPNYAPPMVVPNYSSNPAFPQLPHASSYMVMPNGTSQLAANGMKYGPSHQYKQVFTGTPAGYGGYANHNSYPVSTGVIGNTGNVEDANMSKYRDNNLYAPNLQTETADVWVQAHREIPNMPLAPFYNLMGQPVSPHAAYLPPHNGHAAFSPATPHPAHLQYPGFPHTLQQTSMTMVQNPQAIVHRPAAPPLAGNLGLDMAAMAPGSQVGAFQQNQLGHLGWAPSPTF